MGTQETIGLMMVRGGVLTRPQLNQGLRAQRRTGERLGTSLIKLGFIDSSQLLETLSTQLAIPLLPPEFLSSIAPAVLGQCPGDLACALGVLPVTASGEKLGFAIADGATLSALREESAFRHLEVHGYLASEEAIREAQEQYFGKTPPLCPSVAEEKARPRPPRTGFDSDLSGAGFEPLLLENVVAPVSGRPLPPARIEVVPVELTRRAAPPPVSRLFDSRNINEVIVIAGEILGAWFRRVLVGRLTAQGALVVAHCGFDLCAVEASGAAVPTLRDTGLGRSLSYGSPADDRRVIEIVEIFLPSPSEMALLGTLGERAGVPMFFYGDNDHFPPVYDDLHEVEILFKEVETTLEMLNI